MRGFNLLIKEFKNLGKNKKLLVQILAILFVPILYCGMFVWAFWDPYDKLDELPVAVVNLDEGANYEGKEIEIGKDLVEKLSDNKKFNWKFVSEEEALKGMKNQKYYMMIKIPKDFSEKASTVLDENPSKLLIEYVPNESYNFLSSQIGESTVAKIKDEVSNTLSKTYAEQVFNSIKEVSKGLKTASDGADKINNGVSDAKDGSTNLNNGLGTLSDGSSKLLNGNKTILQGSSDLKEGSSKLYNGIKSSANGAYAINENMNKITDGSNQLNEGLNKLSSGASELNKGAEQVNKGADNLNKGLVQFNQSLQPLLSNLPEEQKTVLQQNLQALVQGSKQVADGTSTLYQKTGELSTGSSYLATNMNTLHQGQIQLADGINKLYLGQEQLLKGAGELNKGEETITSGINTFNDKLYEFDNGIKKVESGSQDLSQGLSKINSGTSEMASKLKNAAGETDKIKTTDKNYDMFADPVNTKIEKLNSVPNYGTGFTPYFLSLGLFVGALLLTIVFDLKTPVDNPKTGLSLFISKFGILAAVGVIQAIIADMILLNGLDLQVKSVPYFIMFSIFTSITFLTLIQMLVTILDDSGRFVAILILILQLTTSAGTFPLELIPDKLQIFNKYLPMTYSIKGFKSVISSGDYSFMWQNAYILMLYITIMAILTIVYYSKKYYNKIAEV